MKYLYLAITGWLTLASSAAAEEYVVYKAPRGASSQGKSFQRDVNDSLVKVMSQCVKDKEARARELVADWIERAKQLKEPNEREVYGQYLLRQKEFIEKHLAGIPGRGSFAELKVKYDQEKAAYDAAFPKAPPTTGDEAKAAVAGLLDYRKRSAEYIKLYDEMIKESPCVHHAGDWAGLAKAGKGVEFRIRNYVQPILTPLMSQYDTWRKLAAVLDKPVPTEYWEHAQYTLDVIHLATATQKLAPLADQITAWSGFLEGSEKTSAAAATADVAKAKVRLDEIAPKLVADVRPPKLPKREEHGAKLRRETKVIGSVVGPPGYGNQETTEIDKQDGRRYDFNRRIYATYYVRSPKGGAPTDFPTLPGIAAKDVCEVWHQSFYSYTKGGPSVKPFNTWYFFQDYKVSYMLCKNAKQPTKMRMKK